MILDKVTVTATDGNNRSRPIEATMSPGGITLVLQNERRFISWNELKSLLSIGECLQYRKQ